MHISYGKRRAAYDLTKSYQDEVDRHDYPYSEGHNKESFMKNKVFWYNGVMSEESSTLGFS